jgi:hypothetical protein
MLPNALLLPLMPRCCQAAAAGPKLAAAAALRLGFLFCEYFYFFDQLYKI